jgi:hypothetical protein
VQNDALAQRLGVPVHVHADCLRNSLIDDELEYRGCSIGSSAGLAPFEDARRKLDHPLFSLPAR